MKKIILLSLFSFLLSICYAQPQAALAINQATIEKEEMGEIIFIRNTGIYGCAVAFRTFIDEGFVCKLNNKRYSKHKVKAGQHDCTAQFYGKKLITRRGTSKIKIRAGEKKYILLVMKYGWFTSRISTVEISETSAIKMIDKLKEDKRY